MRRFKIWAWVAVSFAVWCGSAAPTSAQQTYDFTFSGASGGNLVSIADGVLVLNNNTFAVTSVSGTLSGVSQPAYNGTISLFSGGGLTNQYESPTFYDIMFIADTNNGGRVNFSLNPPGDNSVIQPEGYPEDVGTSTVTPATPAPNPGAGLLSYLVLGFAGLAFCGKRAWKPSDFTP